MRMTQYTREEVIFPAATRTSHADSRAIESNGREGVRIDIDITAFTGTSITFTVKFWDPAKRDWVNLLASAALTSTGHTVLHIDPLMTSASNSIAGVILPKRWKVAPSGTITSVTYSVSATFRG